MSISATDQALICQSAKIDALVIRDGELKTAVEALEQTISNDLLTQESADGIYAKISTIDIIVSDHLALNSNIETGGGTDVTDELNALLAQSFDDDLPRRYIFDGVALTSDTIVAGGHSTLQFLPGSGIFKKADSAGHILTNRLSGSDVMVDKSIVIEGGVFNGNEANQTSRYEDNGDGSGSTLWKVGLWFAGVSSLEMRSVEIRNAKTFALVIGGVKKARIYDYKAAWTVNGAWKTNNWDAIHWWGNNPDTEIYNAESVNGDDDPLGINTDENYLLSDPRRTTNPGVINTGHIGKILVDGFKCTGTYRCVRVYNTGTPSTGLVDELILRNISGTVVAGGSEQSNTAAVWIYEGDPPISKLEITNWQIKSSNGAVVSLNAANIGECTVNGVHPLTWVALGATTKSRSNYPIGLTVGPLMAPAAVANPVQLTLGSDFSSGSPGDVTKMKFRMMPGSGDDYGWGLTTSGVEHHTALGTRHAFYIGGNAVAYQYLNRLEVGTKISAVIPSYADNAAADADVTLLSGQLYRTTGGGRAVFQKP